MAEQDIVERLRRYARNHEGGFPERLLYTVDHQKVDNEAADRLEAVEAENASLRQQLAEARETARREALEEAAKLVHDARADLERQSGTTLNSVTHDALLLASDALELVGEEIRALSHPDREGERI